MPPASATDHRPDGRLPDPEERHARGRAARRAVPRRSHAAWSAAPDREDPVARLLADDAGRLEELVPIRHGRMLTSPFAYFRGSAGVMAADLAGTPVSGIEVQLCGDAHLANFGAFAAPDRRIVFDLNDFDETARGPWEWDVKRLVASFAVAGRHRGMKAGARDALIRRAARAYREAMRGFAAMGNLEVWYSRLDLETLLASRDGRFANRRKKLTRNVEKARGKGSLRAFERLAVHTDGGDPRIAADPPLVVPIEDLLPPDESRDVVEEVMALLAVYRESLPADRAHLLDGYRPVHLARKVVGVGSVGNRAWVVLLIGRDASDPLFLQIKEAGPSALAPYIREPEPEHQGRRVVEGQRLMQAAGDVFLGWMQVTGLDGRERDFYVRQLWDGKRSADLETLDQDGLFVYADACGWTLARAHARTGDRVAIAAYLGGSDRFDRALAEFAETYADRNERDHAALAAAVLSGAVEVVEGV